VSASQAVIEVRDVSKRYGRTLALDNVSLQVEEGELFALLGPNGAGKTTLIHILCTIQAPDTGSARIAGFDMVKKPLLARQRIRVAFQESSLGSTVESSFTPVGIGGTAKQVADSPNPLGQPSGIAGERFSYKRLPCGSGNGRSSARFSLAQL
jgi:ABC-type branched-subunit amino acid transport system ATPase component